MTLSPNIELQHLSPQIVMAALVVNYCYSRQGYAQACVVTSASDVGADFRTQGVPAEKLLLLIESIKVSLGKRFHAGLDRDHIHVHYQPK